MSIILFSLHDDRAMIAVDTLGGASGSEPSAWTRMAKLHVVSHLGLVLAGRGAVEFNTMVARYLDIMPGPGLDEVAQQLGCLLPTVLQTIVDNPANAAVASDILKAGSELVLVGYSVNERTVIAVEFTRLPGSTEFKMDNETTASANPYPRELGELPPLDTEVDFLLCARRQVAVHRKVFPNEPVGGDLMLATVTCDCVTVRNLGNVDP